MKGNWSEQACAEAAGERSWLGWWWAVMGAHMCCCIGLPPAACLLPAASCGWPVLPFDTWCPELVAGYVMNGLCRPGDNSACAWKRWALWAGF